MLQLANFTAFAAQRSVQIDKDGNQIWTVIIKASYLLKPGERPEIAPEQEPVCLAPIYAGEPGRSSLLRESEIVVDHPGTDITILGNAHAPDGKPVCSLDVTVSIGSVSSTIHVIGDRVWEDSLFGPKTTRPKEFTTMPLVYEKSYGGTVMTDESTGDFQHEPHNPIGRGFAQEHRTRSGDHFPIWRTPRT